MSAVISECGLYRYRLERDLKSLVAGAKVFGYFGINPSTADASVDDATVRKWRGFTMTNNGSRFIVGNVFAYRATDVKDLAAASDPVGADNAKHLLQLAADADILIPCWGNRSKLPKHLRHHLDETLNLLFSTGKPVMTFGLTESGDPKHPLMLGYDTVLMPMANKSNGAY